MLRGDCYPAGRDALSHLGRARVESARRKSAPPRPPILRREARASPPGGAAHSENPLRAEGMPARPPGAAFVTSSRLGQVSRRFTSARGPEEQRPPGSTFEAVQGRPGPWRRFQGHVRRARGPLFRESPSEFLRPRRSRRPLGGARVTRGIPATLASLRGRRDPPRALRFLLRPQRLDAPFRRLAKVRRLRVGRADSQSRSSRRRRKVVITGAAAGL